MKEIRTVLCPVDFSGISGRELHLASRICERLGARLVIQHGLAAVPPAGLAVSWMFADEHRRSEESEASETGRRLRGLIAGLSSRARTEAVITSGPEEQALLSLAADLPADLVVMGTHGRTRPEHRSLSERIIVAAPCPVLAIRQECEKLPDFVADAAIPTLVAVDLSPHSLRALDYALDLMRRLPLALHVLHVDERGDEDEAVTRQRLESRIPAELRERVELDLHRGMPVGEILRDERLLESRLIVMGAHHKGLLRTLLGGSTAREVLHESRVPVWFVPSSAALA